MIIHGRAASQLEKAIVHWSSASGCSTDRINSQVSRCDLFARVWVASVHAALAARLVTLSHCWPKKRGMFSEKKVIQSKYDERMLALGVTCGIHCCKATCSKSWEVRNERETQWYWKTDFFLAPWLHSGCLPPWHCLNHIASISDLLNTVFFPAPEPVANLVFTQSLPVRVPVVPLKEESLLTRKSIEGSLFPV